jgi:N-acetylglucosaminyldiphosphoundecaprenol N-acetyl-beta-D-mannosaminyltransferase
MNVIGMRDTVEWIDSRIKKQQFTHHVVVNVAKLVNMRRNSRLRCSVAACDITNVDGMGLIYGARILGISIHEKVSGIDLFHELLVLAARREYPIFLLGAKEEVVEKVVIILQKRYKGLKISGHHHGYFWSDELSIVEEIRKSSARLLFVGITSPKKEEFINRWKGQLGVDFVMGVGGTFDVVAGKVKRAPYWMQIYGFEWLFRTIQEPRRMWKRYLVTNSIFAWLVLKEKIKLVTTKAY